MKAMVFRAACLAVCLLWSGAALAQEKSDPLPDPLTCLVQPARVSEIGSDHVGLVRSVNIRRADRVAQGAVLVELDPAVIEAEITLNQVTIDGLRARLARSESLGERQLIPADEIEQMRTDLKMAEATLARTRIALDRTRILAPFDGVVTDVLVAPGELTGSEPLVRLAATTELKVEMVFIDAAFGRLSLGDPVTLSLPLIDRSVTARIDAIDPFLDPASNTFLVSARIENADGTIPAGIGCAVTGWAG